MWRSTRIRNNQNDKIGVDHNNTSNLSIVHVVVVVIITIVFIYLLIYLFIHLFIYDCYHHRSNDYIIDFIIMATM